MKKHGKAVACVYLDPEDHRRAKLGAVKEGIVLGEWIGQAIRTYAQAEHCSCLGAGCPVCRPEPPIELSSVEQCMELFGWGREQAEDFWARYLASEVAPIYVRSAKEKVSS